MSRKYKFLDKEGLYFVSFATVNWIDVFVRPVYYEPRSWRTRVACAISIISGRIYYFRLNK